MDVHDKETRRRNMRSNRGKDTKLELLVRKFLWHNGHKGYRKHYVNLPGKPDILFIGKKIIVDVKGCFWHRHPKCQFATMPDDNKDFWEDKFNKTVIRDKSNKNFWLENGYKVIEVWGCEMKPKSRRTTLEKLLIELES